MKYESVALVQKADYNIPRDAENCLNLAWAAACDTYEE